MENTIEEKQKSNFQIAKILRFIGCCLLLAGAVSYLVEGWYSVGHIGRYLKFLGITGLVSATGIGTALLLKEDKGARTFLMVAAAIPINFCQLGALLYSVMPFKEVPNSINPFLLWESPSIGIAFLITGIASLVLSGVAYLSFSVLGKQGRELLVPSVILLHLSLLIPVREVFPVCVLTLASVLAAYIVSKKLKKLYAFEYTLEGLFCRALLFAPSALMLLRTATIYSMSHVVAGLILLYIGALFLAATRIFNMSKNVNTFVEYIGGSCLIFGVALEQFAFLEMLGVYSNSIVMPLTAIIILISTELVTRMCKYASSPLRVVAFTVVAFISGTYSLDTNNLFAMSFSLFIGIYGFIYAKQVRSTYIQFVSAILMIIGTKLLATEILPSIIQSWVGLSFIGIIIVLLGSFVDKGILKLDSIEIKE